MAMLMRAPGECGLWFWDLNDVVEPGLASALSTAARPRRPADARWCAGIPSCLARCGSAQQRDPHRSLSVPMPTLRLPAWMVCSSTTCGKHRPWLGDTRA